VGLLLTKEWEEGREGRARIGRREGVDLFLRGEEGEGGEKMEGGLVTRT